MTPILYSSDEIDFLNNGLGQLVDLYDVDIHEQRNGLLNLTAYYPVNGQHYADISEGNIILAKPSPLDNNHAFRIVSVALDITGYAVMIEADSITYDLTNNLSKTIHMLGDGQAAMTAIQNSTLHPHIFTFYSDITHTSESQLRYVNPMEAIAGTQGSFLQIWGGELKRENRRVAMFNRRGRDNVATFRLGKNIAGLKYTVDVSNLTTEIVPTVTVNSTDVSRTIEGTTVQSSRMDNYPLVYSKMVDVSQDVKVDEGDTDDQIKAKINAFAADWFVQSANTGKDLPEVKVEVEVESLQDSADYADKFAKLETIGLTDTVTVYVPEYGVNVTAIVNELHYDPIGERVTSLVVGTAKVSFADANKSALSDLENKVTQVQEQATQAVTSANGKNTNYHGRNKPAHPQEGDLWYYDNGSGTRFMKQFINGDWVTLVDSNTKADISAAYSSAVAESKQFASGLNSSQTAARKSLSMSASTASTSAANERKSMFTKATNMADSAAALADSFSKSTSSAFAEVGKSNASLYAVVADPNKGLSAIATMASEGVTVATKASDVATTAIQTAEGIQTKVEQLGIVNQLINTEFSPDLEGWLATNNGNARVPYRSYLQRDIKSIVIGFNTVNSTEKAYAIFRQTVQLASTTGSGTHVSLSWASFARRTDNYNNLWVHFYDKSGTKVSSSYIAWVDTGSGNTWNTRKKWEGIEIPNTATSMLISFEAREGTQAYLGQPMVVFGETIGDYYTPGNYNNNASVETLRTQTATQFAQEVNDRTNQLNSTTLQLKNLIKSTVTDVENNLQTSIDQMPNSIMLRVGGALSTPNLVPNSKFDNEMSGWTGAVGSSQWHTTTTYSNGASPVVGLSGSSEGYKTVFSPYFSVSPGQTVSASLMWYVKSIGTTSSDYVNMSIAFYDSSFNYINNYPASTIKSANDRFTKYVKNGLAVPDGASYAHFRFYLRGSGVVYASEPMVNVGDTVSEYYQPGPAVTLNTVLDLFNASFSLGVMDNVGTILSGINGDSSGVYITGKHIGLDGDVTVTGKSWLDGAVIKDASIGRAQIADLSVDSAKIINLDVDKISGNVANFIRTYWDGRYGSTSITSEGMTVSAGNTTTKFGNSGMSLTYNGESAGGIGTQGLVGKPDNYQGLTFWLDGNAEYMGWAARAWGDTHSNPNIKMAWYRNNSAPSGSYPGFNFEDDVIFKKGISVPGIAEEKLGFTTKSFNGFTYPYFGDNRMQAGFAYGSSETYLISNGTAYNLSKIIKALSGISSAAIPSGFSSDGKATGWYNVNFR